MRASGTDCIALLRAVNVGGRGTVPMAALRDVVAGLGFDEVRTVLQSGNVVFRGTGAVKPDGLERLLEGAVLEHLALSTHFFVRTAAEWRTVIAGNPFPEDAARDPGHVVVLCMKDAPDATRVAALQSTITGREILRVEGRHAYLVYPDGIGRSRLTNALIERTLGTRATGRNWNTVLKLGALTAHS